VVRQYSTLEHLEQYVSRDAVDLDPRPVGIADRQAARVEPRHAQLPGHHLAALDHRAGLVEEAPEDFRDVMPRDRLVIDVSYARHAPLGRVVAHRAASVDGRSCSLARLIRIEAPDAWANAGHAAQAGVGRRGRVVGVAR